MSCWSLVGDERNRRGIDSDLCYCLENNPQPGYNLLDIKQVLAVVEGERDEANWHWVFELEDGRFVYLTGWCDYTGWDCRSNGESKFFASAVEAACAAPEAQKHYGLPNDAETVRSSLTDQIHTEKWRTWRERKDEEFGVQS